MCSGTGRTHLRLSVPGYNWSPMSANMDRTKTDRMATSRRRRTASNKAPTIVFKPATAQHNTLTLSQQIPLRLYTLPYWSNPPFLIFDIRVLWRSVLSARAPECQKLNMVGYTSMALNTLNSSNLEQLALKGLSLVIVGLVILWLWQLCKDVKQDAHLPHR